MKAATPPVIIIGMHRSGTSLLTRVLQQQGLFMGLGASRNEEAAFTNAVNAWLFHQASATWDRPASIDDLFDDAQVRPWLADYIGRIVNGPAALRFLGVRRWLRYRGLGGVAEPWGWKDPRNTYTLPLWLELFPRARVLHIVRHGVDVAASLRARRARVVAAGTERYRRRRRLYALDPTAPKRRGFGPQPRCRTLEGGLALWEAYVGRARAQMAHLGEGAAEVSYESLLAAPEAELTRALTFCGLPVHAADVAAAAREIDPERAHVWRRDDELRAFAGSVEGRLAHFGYGARDD